MREERADDGRSRYPDRREGGRVHQPGDQERGAACFGQGEDNSDEAVPVGIGPYIDKNPVRRGRASGEVLRQGPKGRRKPACAHPSSPIEPLEKLSCRVGSGSEVGLRALLLEQASGLVVPAVRDL